MNGHDDDRPATFASPPCFMHELDPDYQMDPGVLHSRQHPEVKLWRKAERERLIDIRLSLTAGLRRDYDGQIAQNLADEIGDFKGMIVSAYWPFKGEPNLRHFLKAVVEQGGRCALPVVVGRDEPLEFRAWSPGDMLEPGVWNIPVPRKTAEIVVPDVVIAPVIGFDPNCHRLGYGGGFFDRTLATLTNSPRVFGVGYMLSNIPTIYPQWHDIPMSAVVTEKGVSAIVSRDSEGECKRSHK